MQKNFKARLLRGEKLIGTMATLPSAEVCELLSLVGFDWLFIDGEHGPFETHDIRSIVQAVAGRSACLVRVPGIDEVSIKKSLDVGADGIIAPQVNSSEQAARIVDWCRYPPDGTRGLGLGRAHGYGTQLQDYMDSANHQVTVVIQAEHRMAVENIDAITQVPGIDCVLIGPNDLSASYGKSGQFDDPEIVAAIQRVEAACKGANIPLGIFGVTADAVQPFIDRGFKLIVVGIDALLLGDAARQLLDQLR